MSMSESAIGSPAAAPPAPTAPSAPVSAPTAAPAAPPAAAPVAAPPTNEAAAPAAPASASVPEKPQTYEEAQTKFHEKVEKLRTEGNAQPPAPAESEDPFAIEAESEAPPAVEVPEAPAPKEAAAPEAEAEPGDVETAVFSPEQIESLRLSKAEKAKIARINTQASQMQEVSKAVGGEIGLKIASELVPLLWKDDPTTEDADQLLDLMVLPEYAGAQQMFDLVSTRLINTAIYADDPARDESGKPILDAAGKAVPVGEVFVNKLIGGEWGQQPDGKTPYDLQFVNGIINAHKAWGVDENGKPIDVATIDKLVKGLKAGAINMEYLDNEIGAMDPVKPAEPTPRELELQKQLDERNVKDQEDSTRREAEAEKQRVQEEQRMSTYQAHAKRAVSQHVMKPLMPKIIASGWAPQPGERGPQVEAKQFMADMVSTYFNLKMEGTRTAPDADYAAVQAMIDDGTAFDAAGRFTPRFVRKLEPVQTRAESLWAKAERNLGPWIKFAATTSRNAQLAKKNGTTLETQTPAVAAPPPPEDPNVVKDDAYWEARAERNREKLRKASEGRQTVGVL